MTETAELPAATTPLVSIVIPIYNEAATLYQIVERVQEALAEVPHDIVLVDDGSTDGTEAVIRSIADCGLRNADWEEGWVPDPRLREGRPSGMTNLQVISHATNQGKGAALRTGFAACRARIIVVQDADLEYDPQDISRLVQPIVDGRADVVIGSRFHGEVQRVHLYWHRVGNALLTLLSNLFTNLNLSDMECGYKALRREVIHGITIEENRFGVEPELVAKVARAGWRVFEVPVSYAGRDYAEGKKIGFGDALRAMWCVVKYGRGELRVSRREL